MTVPKLSLYLTSCCVPLVYFFNTWLILLEDIKLLAAHINPIGYSTIYEKYVYPIVFDAHHTRIEPGSWRIVTESGIIRYYAF